jgi:hypothetical protein
VLHLKSRIAENFIKEAPYEATEKCDSGEDLSVKSSTVDSNIKRKSATEEA